MPDGGLRGAAYPVKKGGGQWGLKYLPEEFHRIIGTALMCYGDGAEMAVQAVEASRFADYMLTEIRRILGAEPWEKSGESGGKSEID